MSTSTSTAGRLGAWATSTHPTTEDLALADRSLRDTTAAALAARGDGVLPLLRDLGPAGRWAAAAHIVDFDDLHMESTTHISAVCVAAALACDGDATDYLTGAGVMARLGVALGWGHYRDGWHITCTAGGPGAAAAASSALGLSADQTAAAMAISVASAGGVQRAFGTSAKSLQVGFAADAGVRAARLVSAGASADPLALDQWLELVGGSSELVRTDGPAVPGGLAIKIYPCCYALQRPIEAVLQITAGGRRPAADVRSVRVRTPRSSVHPLIHHRPTTGLEGKFSLEYAVAAALTDEYPGRETFSDAGVSRPALQALLRRVDVDVIEGGAGLLDGHVEVTVTYADSETVEVRLETPAGAPDRPPTPSELSRKIVDCAGDLAGKVDDLTWTDAGAFLDRELGFAANSTLSGSGAR
jgi:2-methylcitrate dehydratase PrpD